MVRIAADAAERIRCNYGSYDLNEWPEFLRHARLSFTITESLPSTVPSLIDRRTIAISASCPESDIAVHVWHEVGHWILHVGERKWWRALPQGALAIRKMERQAWDFAWFFPSWCDAPEMLANVSSDPRARLLHTARQAVLIGIDSEQDRLAVGADHGGPYLVRIGS